MTEQCNGQGYTGNKNCTIGTTCIYLNQWYSQVGYSDSCMIYRKILNCFVKCQLKISITKPTTTTTRSSVATKFASTTTKATFTTTRRSSATLVTTKSTNKALTTPTTTKTTTKRSSSTFKTTTKASLTTTRRLSTSIGTTKTTTKLTTTRTTSNPSALSKFPGCKFKNGRDYDQPTTNYSQYDYVTIWINTLSSDGSGTDFNVWYQGE